MRESMNSFLLLFAVYYATYKESYSIVPELPVRQMDTTNG